MTKPREVDQGRRALLKGAAAAAAVAPLIITDRTIGHLQGSRSTVHGEAGPVCRIALRQARW